MREVERCSCRKHAVVLAVRDRNGMPDQGEVHRCLISQRSIALRWAAIPLGEAALSRSSTRSFEQPQHADARGRTPSRGPPAMSLSTSAPRSFVLRPYYNTARGGGGKRLGEMKLW